MIWFVNVSLTKQEQMCGVALLGHCVTILSACWIYKMFGTHLH
jgi:hypothetical protein